MSICVHSKQSRPCIIDKTAWCASGTDDWICDSEGGCVLRVRFSDLHPVSVSQDHDYPTSFSLTPTKRAGYSRIAGNAHTPRAKTTCASDLVGQVPSSPYPGTGSSNLANYRKDHGFSTLRRISACDILILLVGGGSSAGRQIAAISVFQL